MPAPPETDLLKIRKYCQTRVPTRLRHQFRIEAAVRGGSVTIFDCRPPWHPDLTEWSKVRVAQLRYSPNTRHWSLYWADRNGRWHRYDDLDPGPLEQRSRQIEHIGSAHDDAELELLKAVARQRALCGRAVAARTRHGYASRIPLCSSRDEKTGS